MTKITKEDVNKAILFNNPSVTVMAHNGISLCVEINLFNDHIDWYIKKGEIEYLCSDYFNARDRFVEIVNDLDE